MKTIYPTTPFLTTRYFGPASFLGYRDILTREQWKLLKAIANEEEAYSITSKKFTQKNSLGSSATILQSIKSLQKKSFIY